MNTTKATEYKILLANLKNWLSRNLPSDLNVVLAGTPVIWSGVLDEIIKSQITSIALALSTVCIVLTLWLRSLLLGILTTLPLAATLVFYYASMTILGIDLNIGTSLISFMVIGIVDYSAHFLHRIQLQLKKGSDLDSAVVFAIAHSGKSIFFNVLVFSLGFLALLSSEFAPIVHLGLLVAIALFLSGFMSVFLISLLSPWFIKVPNQIVMAKQA
jgi:predicted RND superfamily exporter protein